MLQITKDLFNPFCIFDQHINTRTLYLKNAGMFVGIPDKQKLKLNIWKSSVYI